MKPYLQHIFNEFLSLLYYKICPHHQILKKISDDIEKKQKRIPSKEEVVAIYEKRRAEHEKKVAELNKKQEVIAPAPSPSPFKKGANPQKG